MESIATPETHDIDFRLGLAARMAARMADEGKVEEALAVVQAVEKELDDKGVVAAQVYVAIGVLQSMQGEMEKALIYMASALDLEPENPFIQTGYEQVVAQANAVLLEAHPWNDRGTRLARMLMAAGLANEGVITLLAERGAVDESSILVAAKA